MVEFIDGKILWANMHFLFWITLLPFSSRWMAENNFLLWPVILYGIILLMVSIAYAIVIKSLLVIHKETSPLTLAVGKNKKIRRTFLLYIADIGLAYVSAYIALAIFLLVGALWLIPNKKIEDKLETEHPSKKEPEKKQQALKKYFLQRKVIIFSFKKKAIMLLTLQHDQPAIIFKSCRSNL